ncbi:hypothetical protein MRB53_038564 [Persea americana]|nr:hypothetical protein MRB53_038564 [Persea americana]
MLPSTTSTMTTLTLPIQIERRRLALAEIDKAPFGWYHVRAIVVAGYWVSSLMPTISSPSTLHLSCWDQSFFGGNTPSTADTAIKAATSGGTVIGQVGFGYLADVVGRKRMYGLELIMIIFATLAQALSSNSPAVTIVGILVFWRVLMGIGIGGDYPLSSIITSEFATTKWRGAMMGSVFAMQVPGCVALYYRLTIPETPRYTFDVSRDVVKAGSDVKAYLNSNAEGVPDEVTRVQAMREAAPQMEIPQASWKDFWAVGYAGGATVYNYFYNVAVGNLILVCAGAIPGYWVTVALVDTVGRKPIQLMGFILLTIFFIIWGFAYQQVGTSGAVALFVLCNFFFNFGPNATTFIVPGECFPTRYRSHLTVFPLLQERLVLSLLKSFIGPLRQIGAPPGSTASPWLNHVLEIFALFMLLGCFTTLLIPETKRKTLEQLAGEVPGTPEYDPKTCRKPQPPNDQRSQDL